MKVLCDILKDGSPLKSNFLLEAILAVTVNIPTTYNDYPL